MSKAASLLTVGINAISLMLNAWCVVAYGSLINLPFAVLSAVVLHFSVSMYQDECEHERRERELRSRLIGNYPRH